MREIVYYSSSAPTSGNFGDDLMKAGRLDIVMHVIIGSFFLSNDMRKDVKLHLVFAGKPDPVKHLELFPALNEELQLSKKDLAWVIRKMLYKYRKGEKHEVFPGYSIERKSLLDVVNDLTLSGKKVFILDPKGQDLRTTNIPSDSVFVMGDQDGLSKDDLKSFKKASYSFVSIGDRPYFASQVLAIVQNELDRRESGI